MIAPRPVSPLRVEVATHLGACVCRPVGVLDATTYGQLRDTLLKAAMEQPSAVLVDMAELTVSAVFSLTVFSTVWMRVCEWPGVPIGLLVEDPVRRQSLARSPMGHFVPVHPDLDTAVRAVGKPPHRRRTTFALEDDLVSSRLAREFTRSTCARWGVGAVGGSAVLVATELVENMLRHTAGGGQLRLELRRGLLTVAVSDSDPRAAVLREATGYAQAGWGLALVARLSKVWGCTPTVGGKVVWSVLRVDAGGPA